MLTQWGWHMCRLETDGAGCGAGVLFAAYMYLRPLIRRRLGSAQSGYLNFYSLHIIWLCSSVFLHLPGLAELGLDVRADMSILLTTFLVSLAVLVVTHVLHALAVALHVIAPALQNPRAGQREVLSIALLNAITLAIACRCGSPSHGLKDFVAKVSIQIF